VALDDRSVMSLSFTRSLRRLDSWQHRSSALGIPVAVTKKFIDGGAHRLGVQIAYWGLFSVFALLLVLASILGFVFESNARPSAPAPGSTLERMPVIGPQISGDIGRLTGSGLALAVGVVGALWTGLGVTLAIGTALDRTWDVPPLKQAGFVDSRLRGLLVLASVGSVNVLATVAVGLATAGGMGSVVTQVLSFFASAVIDLVLFAASFRVLTAAQVTTRQVLPGALLAAGCWLGLQALGGVFRDQGAGREQSDLRRLRGRDRSARVAAARVRADPDRGGAQRRASPQALATLDRRRVAGARQARATSLGTPRNSIPASRSWSNSDSATTNRTADRPAKRISRRR
jgi:uncharacterized BrkB/YihY/UPF0761 family membrane protein